MKRTTGLRPIAELNRNGDLCVSIGELLETVEKESRIRYDQKDNITLLNAWDWSKFRDLWERMEAKYGEEDAWKILYGFWQIRTGEIATVSAS